MRTRRLGALVAILGVVGTGALACTDQGGGRSGERDDVSASAALGTGWDLDGDGSQEYVEVAPHGRELLVFRGTADGPGDRARRWSPKDLHVPGRHLESFGPPASGDINGDGHDDLVTCAEFHRLVDGKGARWSRAGVLLGGARGLSPWITLDSPNRKQEHCGQLTVADLNSDGLDDVIDPGGERIRWVEGSRDAESSDQWTWQNVPPPAPEATGDYSRGRNFETVSVGDLNADGRPDIAYRSMANGTVDGGHDYGIALSVHLGTEEGFAEAESWPDRTEEAVPRFGDVDGDGFDDLVVYEREAIRVQYGSEDGLAPKKDSKTLLKLDESLSVTVGDLAFPPPDTPYEVADLDGDDRADVVLPAVSAVTDAPMPGHLVVLPGSDRQGRSEPYGSGKGRADFSETGNRPFDQETPTERIQARKSPDDADGVELVGTWDTDKLRGYAFDRRDLERRPSLDDDPPKPSTEAAASWDFDGDGNRSLLIPWSTGLAMFDPADDGLSSLNDQVVAPVLESSGFAPRAAESGDLDSDGYADLVLCHDYGILAVFGSREGLDHVVDLGSSGGDLGCDRAEAGDVDGDGYDDVVLAGMNFAGWVQGGPHNRSSEGWTVRELAEESTYLALGEVNGDGHADAAYDERVDTTSWEIRWEVAFGSAAGWRDETRIPGEYGDLAFGDVNGDGFDDLVAQDDLDEERSGVSVFLGSKAGLDPDPVMRLTEEDLGVSTPASRTFAAVHDVADSDGDGYAEIAIGFADAEAAGVPEAGVVIEVPGSENGPVLADAEAIEQGMVPRSGDPESGDGFGGMVEYHDVWDAPGAELLVVRPERTTGTARRS